MYITGMIANKIAKPCEKCIYYEKGKYLSCAHRGCDYEHSEFKERGESDELDASNELGMRYIGEHGSYRDSTD